MNTIVRGHRLLAGICVDEVASQPVRVLDDFFIVLTVGFDIL